MEERYNVYFAGQVLEGYDVRGVRDALAKVFNADQPTLDRLFSGKAQLIKRDCDKTTALKYQATMERAGAASMVKLSANGAVSSNTPPARAMTAAEKIAALAAAPDANPYSSAVAGHGATAEREEATAESGGIVLAPPGTEVLREDERTHYVQREVDTFDLAVDTTAKRLSEEPPPPPAAPDTRHLTMGEVGDTIPNLPSLDAPLSPAIDGMSLTAPGTDFSDCAAPEQQATPRDLSALVVLPAGDPLLEAQYRKLASGAIPSTDHISLED